MEEKFLHSSGEELERLIGQIIEIDPPSLLNRSRIYTTQNWVDVNKLKKALQNQFDDNGVPSGWVSLDKKGNTIYIVGDGNHRIGLACINGSTVPFFVKGVWDDNNKKYGFNIIVKKIRDIGIGLSK